MRKCPSHRCWAWSTTCKHEVKLPTIREGKSGVECDRCDAFWSDEFLDSHPNGCHEFTILDGDWRQCAYCDLQISKRPIMTFGEYNV